MKKAKLLNAIRYGTRIFEKGEVGTYDFYIHSGLTLPSTKVQGFSGYALPIGSRYRLKGLPDPIERMETLKILHRQGLQPETSYLQLLKCYGKQTLSLFRFYRLMPAYIVKSIAFVKCKVKPDSSPVLKYRVFSGVFIKQEATNDSLFT